MSDVAVLTRWAHAKGVSLRFMFWPNDSGDVWDLTTKPGLDGEDHTHFTGSFLEDVIASVVIDYELCENDFSATVQRACRSIREHEKDIQRYGADVVIVKKHVRDLFGPEDAVMRCPVCDNTYTHPLGAYTRIGSNPIEADGPYLGTEAVGVTTTREERSALVVMFYCESGHRFSLVIQQHEGINLCYLERMPDDPAYSEATRAFPDPFNAKWAAGKVKAEARMRENAQARVKRSADIAEYERQKKQDIH
jgi:hypothetical protein